jgi:ribose transport system substrate-binding protein
MISLMKSGTESLPSRQKAARDYSLDLVGKTIDILETLRRQGELRLTDIVENTRMDKSTTFRILYTLQERGYVVRDLRTKKFRLPVGHRKFRIGYAQPNAGHHFGDVVTRGLLKEAQIRGIEVLVVDNRWDPDEAVKNAHWLVQQKVDFAIEFQVHYEVAPLIAEIFAKAEIRTLALGAPQPGAIYFGPNNYSVGLLCGETLARHAAVHWRGRLDRVVLLEFPFVGRMVQSRLVGTLKGIQQHLRGFDQRRVMQRDAKGNEPGGYRAMQKILKSVSKGDHLLVAAINDDCAQGALRAVREAGREQFTAIMGFGFDALPSFIEEMRKQDSPLIGSVAFFPEKDGAEALSIATRCLNGEAIPPSIYTEHKLVTRENIDEMLAAPRGLVEAPPVRNVAGSRSQKHG